jgi:2-isopropylmalate synthase
VQGAEWVRDYAARQPGNTEFVFQYSPESFTGTEIDYAIEVCEAVMDVWQPTKAKRCIFNLPATVEMSTPNIYADQIEWFGRHIRNRDCVVISLHPHNDRGTGVAAAELGLMAGADRVEGCLFGNGERTGNCDLVTVGLNLYTQGINPGLDFSNMEEIVQTVTYCNQLPVHPRHPYAGELVFTAFSGSHQDAIKKGFAAQEARNDELWNVPYLPIDPADIGCSYEAVIRVNSQSGKGGVAWVLQQDKGLKLPKRMQGDFSKVVQDLADKSSRELHANDIWDAFQSHYCLTGPQPYRLVDYFESGPAGHRVFTGKIAHNGEERSISGRGNGLISSVLAALRDELGIGLDVTDYSEHAIGTGRDVRAAAYVECKTDDGRTIFGVGLDEDIATASVQAVLSVANGLERRNAAEAKAA